METTAELCDAECPAASQIKVVREDAVLIFCNHHYAYYASSLSDDGWTLVVPESWSSELVESV